MEMIKQLSGFERVDIDSIERIQLFTNRKDFKFLFGIDSMSEILQEMQKDYVLMTVNGNFQQEYKTYYFDTPDLRFYNDHHNSILNRMKVRSRYYSDGKAFLEVKKKNNKGLTLKNRIPFHLNSEFISFDTALREELDLPLEMDLDLQLKVAYIRLTFFSISSDEKVTIDTHLSFHRGLLHNSMSSLVVAESKGVGHERSSFNQLMKFHKIKRSSFSKYCFGLSLLEPAVKKNNFKSLHRKANKFIHAYELS